MIALYRYLRSLVRSLHKPRTTYGFSLDYGTTVEKYREVMIRYCLETRSLQPYWAKKPIVYPRMVVTLRYPDGYKEEHVRNCHDTSIWQAEARIIALREINNRLNKDALGERLRVNNCLACRYYSAFTAPPCAVNPLVTLGCRDWEGKE